MNYFNYFTEVEDHFRRARGSGLWRMSPRDWALVEAWKDAGVPLEAVLKGIDRAFAKFRQRRRSSSVNSVAYCAHEVMEAARTAARPLPRPRQQARPGLEPSRLVPFLRERADRLRELADTADGPWVVCGEAADTLESLAIGVETGDGLDLEDLERRLTVLEDRVAEAARGSLDKQRLRSARRDLDKQLKPYRRRLDAVQLSMLEQRHLRRMCLETLGLPRLSLFFVE